MTNTFTVRAHAQGQTTPGEEVMIDGAPLTVIVPSQGIDNVDVLDDDVMLIDPESTVRFAREFPIDAWSLLSKAPRFVTLWRKVNRDTDPPETLENAGLGTLHLAGMMLMIALAVMSGKRPHIKFPETYLHPGQQTGLADLFRAMQNGDSKS